MVIPRENHSKVKAKRDDGVMRYSSTPGSGSAVVAAVVAVVAFAVVVEVVFAFVDAVAAGSVPSPPSVSSTTDTSEQPERTGKRIRSTARRSVRDERIRFIVFSLIIYRTRF